MDLETLVRLFSAAGQDRELLRQLMRAAAEMAQALSGMRLSEPPESALDLPAWIAEYDRVATAARAPSSREWIGVQFNPLPQEPPLPWLVLIGQAARANEPGIASALQTAAGAYDDIEQQGSSALRDLVDDAPLRRWAAARIARERGTGSGSGLQPRALASSSGIGPLLLAGGGLLLLSRAKSDQLPWLLGGLAAVAIATRTRSSSPSSSSAAPLPAGSSPSSSSPLPTPTRYADAKAPMLLRRWEARSEGTTSTLGSVISELAPQVYPGVPPLAWLGFTAIAVSQTEVTSANEVGYFQTPLRAYERLADDDLVQALLGHTANPAQWRTRVDEQTAVGLADLRAHLEGLAALGWQSSAGTVWRVALTFAGFSAGDGGVNEAWQRFRSDLADVGEESRFTRLGQLIVQAWRSGGRALEPASAHPNPAYTWLRSAQKLACGRAVALLLEARNQRSYGSEWFPVFPADLENSIAQAAAGRVPPTTEGT